MATDTYSELQTSVASWLQRSDLAAQIPQFIEFATARFNAALRVPQMEQIAQTTITGEWTELPTDFLALRYIETADGKRMQHVTPEGYALEVKRNANPSPPVYMIGDMSFRVYPGQSNLAVEILYYRRIPALVNANDTNWLLTEQPSAYLAASLAEAFDYVRDAESAARWDARTREHIERIQRSGKRILEGASTMKIRTA